MVETRKRFNHKKKFQKKKQQLKKQESNFKKYQREDA